MELGLTFNREGESVTLSLPFNVGGDASVETCSRSIDTLQDETLVAHDDPGAAVVVNHFPLKFASQPTKRDNIIFISSRNGQ